MRSVTRSFPRRLAESVQATDEHEAAWSTVDSLVAAVSKHDTYTGGHSHRVAEVASNLARLLGSTKADVAFVKRAALAHDIGKVGIPIAVLRKTSPLTDEELHLVRLHPIMGASILSRMPAMERYIPVVLHHHEQWDGGGYPSGLSEVSIPLESRIIHIADAFDAMCSRPPYGRGLDLDAALAEMRAHSGTQFDPLLVDAMHEAYRHGLLDDSTGPIVLPQTGWTMML